jgi:hypothetical protein
MELSASPCLERRMLLARFRRHPAPRLFGIRRPSRPVSSRIVRDQRPLPRRPRPHPQPSLPNGLHSPHPHYRRHATRRPRSLNRGSPKRRLQPHRPRARRRHPRLNQDRSRARLRPLPGRHRFRYRRGRSRSSLLSGAGIALVLTTQRKYRLSLPTFHLNW